ncbi:MAG: hypothetical protein EOO88_10565 [Pedobacter sp.]|nr:MAG: hypothetical protein EOO88_10565 [Pedobacter sp.]
MKRTILWLIIAMGPCFALAQTKVNKSYPVAKGQTVSFHFDYPKTVHISTWDGSEIVVEATVKINNGESDRAFSLSASTSGNTVSISNKLDMDLIPEAYYIVDKGIKVRFNSRQDLDAYVADKGSTRISTYQQKDVEVSINIKVPAGISTELTSIYGMVELENFNGPIKVDAKYGGVDASLSEKSIGKLQLTTRYGKIFSNLTFRPTEQTQKDFYTAITAAPGNGPSYDFNSAYGNIYLRSSVK